MSNPHNPPAFPNSGAYGHTGEYLPEGGMTLRDWFAGQALAILDQTTALTIAKMDRTTPAAVLAKNAYAIADAMLAARTLNTGEAV